MSPAFQTLAALAILEAALVAAEEVLAPQREQRSRSIAATVPAFAAALT